MTDQLRALAEAEAAKIPQQPTITALPSLPIDFTNKVREGFVQGFIAGRTSVTREQIVDVLVMSPLSDYAGTEMGPINRTADAVLALLNGGPDDPC